MLATNLLNYLFSSNLIFTLIAFMIIYALTEVYRNIKLRKRLPSGPLGLPFVGYLPFLGKDPQITITKLGERYGNVFTVPLGMRNVVILNDLESINDAFHKDAFLGRPDETAFSVLGGVKSFVDVSGNEWRENRRHALSVLRDLGFGKSHMEDRISDEISYFIKEIDKSNGSPINVGKLLIPSISNNVCSFVFGNRMDYNDPLRIAIDQTLGPLSKLVSQTGILANYPKWFGRMCLSLGILTKFKRFISPNFFFIHEISKHRDSLNANNIKDYIDGYLIAIEEKRKRDPNTTFTDKMLLGNVREFFNAGSDTVRSTLEWSLLMIAGNKMFQENIHKEIDKVIGMERKPAWNDHLNMPYLQSFIIEIFRWKPIIPLNVYRSTVEDTSVLGHFIPKNTTVLANFWSVHHDPKLWDNPETFNPKRFLNDDETVVIKHDAVMPFSIGKRSCIGENLARIEIFLYITSLLQRYNITCDNAITYEDRYGIIVAPKDDVILRFNIRNQI